MTIQKQDQNLTRLLAGDAYSRTVTRTRLMVYKSAKSKKDGTVMVYCETVFVVNTPSGRSEKFDRRPTQIRVPLESWSVSKEAVKPSHPDAKDLNEKLEAFVANVEGYVNKKITGAPFMVSLPQEIETFDKHFNRKTLIEYLEEYIKHRQAIETRTSWKEYRTLKGRLEAFQKHFNKVLYFEDINFEFADQVRMWAKVVDYNPNTLKKTFDALGTFLNFYYHDQKKLNFELSIDFREKKFRFVPGTNEADASPLYMDEIQRLVEFKPTAGLKYTDKGKEFNFTINAQYRIQKLFLLACCTGLRFTDLTKLQRGNFKGDTIEVRASKTDKKKVMTLHLPIVPIAREILEEIDYDFSRIILSNQRANLCLTALLKHIGIDTPTIVYKYSLNGGRTEIQLPKYDVMTFHSGRDSFITNCLIAGLDHLIVMGWSGHTKFETFKKYVLLSQAYLRTNHQVAINYFASIKK